MPNLDLARIFTDFYERKVWGSAPTSGPGSTTESTVAIRSWLPRLIEQLGVKTLLDIPCGDYSWMSTLDLPVDYIGGDIVTALIHENQARYADARRQFQELDITCSPLPMADLLLCRDCFLHFPNAAILAALTNIKASGSTYLLTTSFMDQGDNPDIEIGGFHPVNLLVEPFNLPAPLQVMREPADATAWPDKCLALWPIATLRECI